MDDFPRIERQPNQNIHQSSAVQKSEQFPTGEIKAGQKEHIVSPKTTNEFDRILDVFLKQNEDLYTRPKKIVCKVATENPNEVNQAYSFLRKTNLSIKNEMKNPEISMQKFESFDDALKEMKIKHTEIEPEETPFVSDEVTEGPLRTGEKTPFEDVLEKMVNEPDKPSYESLEEMAKETPFDIPVPGESSKKEATAAGVQTKEGSTSKESSAGVKIKSKNNFKKVLDSIKKGKISKNKIKFFTDEIKKDSAVINNLFDEMVNAKTGKEGRTIYRLLVKTAFNLRKKRDVKSANKVFAKIWGVEITDVRSPKPFSKTLRAQKKFSKQRSAIFETMYSHFSSLSKEKMAQKMKKININSNDIYKKLKEENPEVTLRDVLQNGVDNSIFANEIKVFLNCIAENQDVVNFLDSRLCSILMNIADVPEFTKDLTLLFRSEGFKNYISSSDLTLEELQQKEELPDHEMIEHLKKENEFLRLCAVVKELIPNDTTLNEFIDKTIEKSRPRLFNYFAHLPDTWRDAQMRVFKDADGKEKRPEFHPEFGDYRSVGRALESYLKKVSNLKPKYLDMKTDDFNKIIDKVDTIVRKLGKKATNEHWNKIDLQEKKEIMKKQNPYYKYVYYTKIIQKSEVDEKKWGKMEVLEPVAKAFDNMIDGMDKKGINELRTKWDKVQRHPIKLKNVPKEEENEAIFYDESIKDLILFSRHIHENPSFLNSMDDRLCGFIINTESFNREIVKKEFDKLYKSDGLLEWTSKLNKRNENRIDEFHEENKIIDQLKIENELATMCKMMRTEGLNSPEKYSNIENQSGKRIEKMAKQLSEEKLKEMINSRDFYPDGGRYPVVGGIIKKILKEEKPVA